MASATTRGRILTAAEDVVLSEGVAHLTLEKAAARAGVSKGGVLYHFPARSALVAAMVERLAAGYDDALAGRPGGPAGSGDAFARAYVDETFGEIATPRAERAQRLGAAVLAAMASEPELLAPLRAAFTRWQARIEQDSADPVPATIARLAADGLWLSELFGLGPLDDDLRRRVRAALLSALDAS